MRRAKCNKLQRPRIIYDDYNLGRVQDVPSDQGKCLKSYTGGSDHDQSQEQDPH